MSRFRYDATNLGAAQRSSALTVLLITAGSLPLRVLASYLEVTDNATSYQLDAGWKFVTSFSPTPAGRGTTTVTPGHEDYPGEGFTVIGDIDAEPNYDSSILREAHGGPSVIGYFSPKGVEIEPIQINPTDSWGLVILTASPAGSIFRAGALLEEG